MKNVAIKVIPLDSFNKEHSLDDVKNEINYIGTCNHPNVLNYYTSFTVEKELWIVMPLMSAGSLGKLQKAKNKNGIKNEELIASILL